MELGRPPGPLGSRAMWEHSTRWPASNPRTIFSSTARARVELLTLKQTAQAHFTLGSSSRVANKKKNPRRLTGGDFLLPPQ